MSQTIQRLQFEAYIVSCGLRKAASELGWSCWGRGGVTAWRGHWVREGPH